MSLADGIGLMILAALVGCAWSAAHELEKLNQKAEEGFRDIARSMAELQRSIKADADHRYGVLTEIRDILAGTPSKSMRKFIEDYKERDRMDAEMRSLQP